MTVKIVKHPIVHLDIVDQAVFIADDNPQAAERFIDAVEEAFKLLASRPGIGSLRRFRNKTLEGIRMWPVKGFEKHLIFYRPRVKSIEIIRVLHGARDIDQIFEQDEE